MCVWNVHRAKSRDCCPWSRDHYVTRIRTNRMRSLEKVANERPRARHVNNSVKLIGATNWNAGTLPTFRCSESEVGQLPHFLSINFSNRLLLFVLPSINVLLVFRYLKLFASLQYEVHMNNQNQPLTRMYFITTNCVLTVYNIDPCSTHLNWRKIGNLNCFYS